MKLMKVQQINIFLFFLLFVTTFSTFAREYNVLDFGAKGDGQTIDTKSIQNAIEACNKSGGIVVFPSGKYLSGTIYLKSNVTFHLQKGATILGSTNLANYPENLPEYTFFRKGIIKRALIYVEKCENIAIEGEGTIDGQGAAFEEPTEKNVNSYSVRPYVIWMIKCKNVRIIIFIKRIVS